MKKNKNLLDNVQSHSVTIRALSHDGRGITTFNEKTMFVSGALKEEVVNFKIIGKHRHYYEAEATDILIPAAQRAIPACSHYTICGGCSLQHMHDQNQLELKETILLEQLKHFGKVTPENILPPLSLETLGYRRKARLGVKYVYKKNKLLVGFREKSSRYLADLNHCLVLHPKIGNNLLALSHLIASLSVYETIPQIEVAIGDEELALVFRHLVPLLPADKEKLIAFAKENRYQIYLQPNPPSPLEKLWPQDNNFYLKYTLPNQNLEFLFHPLDFTQINLEINRMMVNQALHLLELQAHENVLDLFCGIGNFTLAMAKYCAQVVGIEGTAEMVTRAKSNAKHNQIHNAIFYSQNLFKTLENTPWSSLSYDKILIDPPRAGAKEILPLLSQMQAKRIVYVSCNPATLARDAGELVHQHKYRLKKVGVLNMFPHTAHIEAIAVFDKT